MRKDAVYRLLEEKMQKYCDYAGVAVQPNHEIMLSIPESAHLKVRQIDPKMHAHTGDKIFVRQSVLNNLKQAAEILQLQAPELELEVVYGYRSLEVQIELFEEYKLKLSKKFTENHLMEAVHRFIAVPDVAGHPTGGAVDVQLLKNGKPLDFGTLIWEFVEDALVFSPFISKEAWENRQLLRHIMLLSGFAPFDGEWWHFSYGDKEWAKYYKKPFAYYEQINSLMIKDLNF